MKAIPEKKIFGFFLAVFLVLGPVYKTNAENYRLDVNLIIDCSTSLSNVRDEVTGWISDYLVDKRLETGDRITIWSAGDEARVIYSDTIKSGEDKTEVKNILLGLSSGGQDANFSGALREAASRNSGNDISYTMLVSASVSAISPTLLGPQASLMRISRVEEFRTWRVFIVGLNIDPQVKRAAAGFM